MYQFETTKRERKMAQYGNIKQRDKVRSTTKRIELQQESDAGVAALANAIDNITAGSVLETSRTIDIASGMGGSTDVILGNEVVFVFEDDNAKAMPFRLRGVDASFINNGGSVMLSASEIVAFASAVVTNAKLSDGEIPTRLREAYAVK
jgi:hypothetical protein